MATASKRRRRKEKRSIHNPAVPLTASAIFDYLGGGSRSAAGVPVNEKTALRVAPVWQAVDIISSDISRLPFCVKRDGPNGGYEVDKKHPASKLLTRWSGDTTPNIWFSRVLGHALLYGNGYSLIERRGNIPAALRWYRRSQVEPEWERGKYFYLVQHETQKDGRGDLERVHPLDMMHLQGLTVDEFGGLSLIDYARNTIGREIAAETFGDDFFSNNAVPSGWFEHPAELGDEAYKRFLASVERRHRGNGNRHKIGILEEGMQWKPAGVNPVDAMLIDMMKWGTKDVARFFNLPPHKLGDDSRVNYNSLEQENKSYFDSSLGKWVSRLLFELNAKLFTEDELDQGYRVECDIDSWGKADTAARYQSYAIAIQWGILNPNEVRFMEGRNPYEGGDEYLKPLTHGGAPDPPAPNADPAQDPPADPPTEPQPDPAARAALYDIVRDRVEAAARLLANAADRAAIKAMKQGANYLASINGLDERYRSAVEGKLSAAVVAVNNGTSVTTLADKLIGAASARFVEASDCPADQLPAKVADAGLGLRSYAQGLARAFVFGGSLDEC